MSELKLKGVARARSEKEEGFGHEQNQQLELELKKKQQSDIFSHAEPDELRGVVKNSAVPRGNGEGLKGLRYLMAEIEGAIQALEKQLSAAEAFNAEAAEFSAHSHIGLLIKTQITRLLENKDMLEELGDFRFMISLQYAYSELANSHPRLLGAEALQKAFRQQTKIANWSQKTGPDGATAFDSEALHHLVNRLNGLTHELSVAPSAIDSLHKIEFNKSLLLEWEESLALAEKTVRSLWKEVANWATLLKHHRIGIAEIQFVTGKDILDPSEILAIVHESQTKLKEAWELIKRIELVRQKDQAVLDEALEYLKNNQFGSAESAMSASSSPVNVAFEVSEQPEQTTPTATCRWVDLDLEQVGRALGAEWENLRIRIAKTARWSRKRAVAMAELFLSSHAESQFISNRLREFKSVLLEDIAAANLVWRKRLTTVFVWTVVAVSIAGAFWHKLLKDADRLRDEQLLLGESTAGLEPLKDDNEKRTPALGVGGAEAGAPLLTQQNPPTQVAQGAQKGENKPPTPAPGAPSIPASAVSSAEEAKVLTDPSGNAYRLIPASNFQTGSTRENEEILRLTASLHAATDDAALYNESFGHFKKADQLDKSGSPNLALGIYHEVAKTLVLLKTKHPNWSPLVVANLAKLTAERVRRLEAQPSALMTSKSEFVTLNSFYAGETEVTLSEWKSVKSWAEQNGYAFTNAGHGSENHPVTGVSWHDAVKWCNAKSQMEGLRPAYFTSEARGVADIYRSAELSLSDAMVDWEANGYRLPTAAEWEKAARGGLDGKDFPNGDSLESSEANFGGRMGATKAVKTYQPNSFGLFDMAGNVSEWCWNATGETPAAPAGASAPPGPGHLRIHRGGGWNATIETCRVHRLEASAPNSTGNQLGFRILRKP